jgi:hypothetical protein
VIGDQEMGLLAGIKIKDEQNCSPFERSRFSGQIKHKKAGKFSGQKSRV